MSKHEDVIKRIVAEGFTVTISGDTVVSPTGQTRKLRVRDGKNGRPPYYTFNVKHEGKSYPVKVHKLVAYIKFGPDAFKFLVRHLDGNSLNNDWTNLALGNGSQNAYDRPRQERLEHARKAARTQRRLSEEQVLEIRASKDSLKVLVERYGVSKTTISYVRNGKTYNT